MRFKHFMFFRRTTLWAACITGFVGSGCQPANTPAQRTATVGETAPLAQPSVLPTLYQSGANGADFSGHELTAEVRYVADRVVKSNDANGLPFLIVDKTNAQVVALLMFDRRSAPRPLGVL
jgi:hypothetical protein